MTRSASFAGVILAAGESSRMGSDKALLPWPAAGEARGETFLSAAIRSLELYTDFVIVVAGQNESAIAPIVYAQGASLVVNPDPSRGQFSSLRVGLQEVLNRGRDAAIVTLVDRPPAAGSTLQALRNAFSTAAAEVWAVVPEFQGRHGHPYVAGREMIEAFLHAPAASNPREVEHQQQRHIQYVQVDDANVGMNINTASDYAALGNQPRDTKVNTF